jgi:hypothetical protein
MIDKLKKLVGAGVLGAGILGMAVPAKALSYFTNTPIISRSTVGTASHVITGATASNTQCSITAWSGGDSTSQHAGCQLGNPSGTWVLYANVYNTGASVSCAATCYK